LLSVLSNTLESMGKALRLLATRATVLRALDKFC